MDVKQEVRDFLVSRRSRITPEKAGLPALSTRSDLFRTLWATTTCASTAPAARGSTTRWWAT